MSTFPNSKETDLATCRILIQELGKRIEQKFNETDLRYEQHFQAQRDAVAAALVAQEKAVIAALGAADRAVTKAEVAAEKRFESVNEFRAVLVEQSNRMATKAELEIAIKATRETADLAIRNLLDKFDGPTGLARIVFEMRATYDTLRQDKASNLQTWISIIAIIVGAGVALWVAMSRVTPITYPQPTTYSNRINPQ